MKIKSTEGLPYYSEYKDYIDGVIKNLESKRFDYYTWTEVETLQNIPHINWIYETAYPASCVGMCMYKAIENFDFEIEDESPIASMFQVTASSAIDITLDFVAKLLEIDPKILRNMTSFDICETDIESWTEENGAYFPGFEESVSNLVNAILEAQKKRVTSSEDT